MVLQRGLERKNGWYQCLYFLIESLIFLSLSRKTQAEWCIKTAAKIISPAVEATYSAGYDWYVFSFGIKINYQNCPFCGQGFLLSLKIQRNCEEELKIVLLRDCDTVSYACIIVCESFKFHFVPRSRCIDQVRSSTYVELSHDLEIDKAIGYLKQKDFQQVSALPC